MHEFRTPLTLMLGPIEDALDDREDPLDAQQRERITMVQRNGGRVRQVMGQFTLTPWLTTLGWLASAVMAMAAIGMFATWGS